MTVIDIVQRECNEIVERNYKNDSCKPYVMISQMYHEDRHRYIITLIHSNEEKYFEYRQSDFIDLYTDLEKTIEVLYNRTM